MASNDLLLQADLDPTKVVELVLTEAQLLILEVDFALATRPNVPQTPSAAYKDLSPFGR